MWQEPNRGQQGGCCMSRRHPILCSNPGAKGGFPDKRRVCSQEIPASQLRPICLCVPALMPTCLATKLAWEDVTLMAWCPFRAAGWAGFRRGAVMATVMPAGDTGSREAEGVLDVLHGKPGAALFRGR